MNKILLFLLIVLLGGCQDNIKTLVYLQPIVTQYLVCNKSEIWP